MWSLLLSSSSMSSMRIRSICVYLCLAHVVYNPVVVNASTCGTALTKECLASKDKRYNVNASTALKDLSPAWARVEGLFSGVFHTYSPGTFERLITLDDVSDITGTNQYRYDQPPTRPPFCGSHVFLCQAVFVWLSRWTPQ